MTFDATLANTVQMMVIFQWEQWYVRHHVHIPICPMGINISNVSFTNHLFILLNKINMDNHGQYGYGINTNHKKGQKEVVDSYKIFYPFDHDYGVQNYPPMRRL